MAIKVRLRRMGNRNRAFFRVVAADSRAATTGRFVENLGWYDPRQSGVNFRLNQDRIDYWEQNGAEFSSTVKNLVKQARELPPEATAVTGPEPAGETPADAPADTPEPAPPPAEEPAAPASDEKPEEA